MTPDEQHAWEVLKAMSEKKAVSVKLADGSDEWLEINGIASTYIAFVASIVKHPHLYRIAKEGEE